MAGFCEVSCVKYCVFTFPLVVTAVQTHGGVQSALRRIHAPTRNEEGTYIRASVASDVATLSTPNIPSHQGMMMNIFLLGGWVGGTPKCFFIFVLALVPCLTLLAWSAVRGRLACSLHSRLTVLILTALCWPYLFLVYLAFPHCLALILH